MQIDAKSNVISKCLNVTSEAIRADKTQNAYAISPRRHGNQLPDVHIRRDISNSSRIHVPRQFYPVLVAPAVENSDVTARHVGY